MSHRRQIGTYEMPIIGTGKSDDPYRPKYRVRFVSDDLSGFDFNTMRVVVRASLSKEEERALLRDPDVKKVERDK